MSLPKFTPEQMALNLEKAKIAREQKRLAREANKGNLKLEYLDSNYWASLASEYKIRMPSPEEQADASCIRKYLKRADVSFDTFNDHFTSIKYFLENNPKLTKYAVAGLILELKDNL